MRSVWVGGAMTAAVVLAGLVWMSGCKVENVPTRAEMNQQKQERKPASAGALGGDTTREAPASTVDDSELVLRACGRPESDRTLAIYSKLDHGPVRELRYKGLQPVLLEFVPNRASVRGAPGRALTAQLATGDVWVFDDAYMENEEIMTTGRLGIYLPCAARALRNED